ncbi:hypothetical protein [Deinococcus sp. YIM 77859]|uniref:hypothetical protein n=1 Tax=Deinococcus sp. YIM 77859 TaxID=1540221 RepID=UPI001E4D8AC3|nr:hypothetical protein [Deinococcus sp. YIM 77859]
MLEDETAEQQGHQQRVAELLVLESLLVAEMPLGPAVKLTDDGPPTSTVVETVSTHTVSIFSRLRAARDRLTQALNGVTNSLPVELQTLLTYGAFTPMRPQMCL